MTTKPQLETRMTNTNDQLHQVMLFDCSCHMFDDVVLQITKATGCSDSQAVQYAKVAEQFGCVAVFNGSSVECNKVITILTSTGLNANIQ